MTAGLTLADATAQLAAWLAADAAVARNQSYSINTDGVSRSLTRADAAQITEKVKFWQAQVERLTPAGSGRRRLRYVVPD